MSRASDAEAGASSAARVDRSLDRAARGSFINLVGSVVSTIANFGLTVLITRLVSQEDAGVFFSATSLFLLAMAIGQLGTETGLVYFISGSRGRGELRHARSYMRVAAKPVLLMSVLLGALVLVTAEPLGALLSPGREEEFATYMRVMAFFVPCAAVMNLSLAGTQGLGTMRPYALLDHVAKPMLQVILVGLALTFLGGDTIGWAWSAAYLPVAILAWIWWKRLSERAARQVRETEFRAAGPFWRFSTPRAFANVTQVAMQRLDIILVGALAGLPEAAIYAAATRFLVIGQMVGRAVALSGQPLLGESLAKDDRANVKRLYRVTTSWLVLATWPWYLTLIFWGSSLLRVFGDGYEIGDAALILLCGAMLFATSCGMIDMVLNMAGRSLANLVNVTAAFTVYLVLDLLLIPSLGLLGAAIGWGCAIVVANLLPLIQVWSSLGIHPYGRSTAIALASSAASFGVLPLLVSTFAGPSIASLVVALSVGTTMHASVILWFRKELEVYVLLGALRRRVKSKARTTQNPR